MSCIKNQYRKMMQNVEAIKRQQEANPSAFKLAHEDQVRAASAGSVKQADEKEKEEAKGDDVASKDQQDDEGAGDEESRKEPEEKKKREAIDKQQAYLEYKESEEGQVLQQRIAGFRESGRSMREQIKGVTAEINGNKKEIDELKMRLDRKEEERKVRLRDEQLRQEDMFD